MSCKVKIKELQRKQRHYKRYKRCFGQNVSHSAFVSTDLHTLYKYVRQSCAEPTANRHLQRRYMRQATMSDLASENNTYGKRKWSQIATEMWDVPQVPKVLMSVKIASAIDSGRGCNLSGYQNIVNVERGKNKRRVW
jgi:hypothetical protein